MNRIKTEYKTIISTLIILVDLIISLILFLKMNFKRLHKGKKKKISKRKKKRDVIDEAAALLAAENAKKDMIKSLMIKTDLSEEELLKAYDDFHAENTLFCIMLS